MIVMIIVYQDIHSSIQLCLLHPEYGPTGDIPTFKEPRIVILQQFSLKLGNVKLYFPLKLPAKFMLLKGRQDKIEYIIIVRQHGTSCRDKKSAGNIII